MGKEVSEVLVEVGKIEVSIQVNVAPLSLHVPEVSDR
jgi:hypothetical protein